MVRAAPPMTSRNSVAKGHSTEDRRLAPLRTSTRRSARRNCSGGVARNGIRPLLAASTRPETHSKLSNPPRRSTDRPALRKPQSRHAQPLYGTWCGRLRIHSLVFIASDKGQTGARIVSRCEGTATLRHNRILHQCIIMSRSLPASERVFVLTVSAIRQVFKDGHQIVLR